MCYGSLSWRIGDDGHSTSDNVMEWDEFSEHGNTILYQMITPGLSQYTC